MAPKLSHTKVFDEPYLFNREAQILADLHQRDAPVPRVLAMDHVQKSLTMDHDGTSLETAIANLPQSPSVHKAWLSRLLPPLVQAVTDVCQQEVFHLDLACRNFLVDQFEEGEPQIKLIDFGVALSARLPLQKPLWVIPDPRLHHPRLVTAAADDWRVFFRDSEAAAAIYRRKGLATPTDFVGRAFDIPLEAYQSYWPKSVAADSLDKRWCLVGHSFAELLEELSRRLSVSGVEHQFLTDSSARLRSLQDDALVKERLLALPLAASGMGGTPRPKAFYAPDPPASEGALKAQAWQALAPWRRLCRPMAIAILLVNYFYIDTQYKNNQLALSDLGFYAALISLVAGALALLALLSARLQGLALVSLLVMSTTQVWYGFEMASQGLGLSTSLTLGLGLVTALGLAKAANNRVR